MYKVCIRENYKTLITKKLNKWRGISCTWAPAACGLLRPSSFAGRDVFGVHPQCSVCHCFIQLSSDSSFTHPPLMADGYLGVSTFSHRCVCVCVCLITISSFILGNLFFVYFTLFLAVPHGMWHLSSPTRGGTCAPWAGSMEPWPVETRDVLKFVSFLN